MLSFVSEIGQINYGDTLSPRAYRRRAGKSVEYIKINKGVFERVTYFVVNTALEYL